MSMLSDVKGFFNDVGNWIDDKIIQPIGSWWNSGIERAKQGKTIYDQIDDKIKESGLTEKVAKGIENSKIGEIGKKIGEYYENNYINSIPFATEEQKREEQESYNKALENQGLKKPETTGNNQEKEATGNTQQSDIPSIQELWEREDAIRKETQEREDTAYQRAVDDMRKAGINPNLVGVNPASSGGGIISATGQNLISTEMSGIINQTIAEINNTVKADENQKERINDIIKTLAMYMLLKK